jgi:hypothetical protein
MNAGSTTCSPVGFVMGSRPPRDDAERCWGRATTHGAKGCCGPREIARGPRGVA